MFGFISATLYLLPLLAHSFEVKNIMFPNERTSLQDCRLRYYRNYEIGFSKPVYGYPVRPREFPHMAAIGWTQPNGTILWECGGSLIWDNFVLTAAHCTFKSDIAAPDVLRLGDIDLSSSEDDEWVQEFRIDKIIRHPKHSYFRKYHDIALLKLDRAVEITDKGSVVPACLWKDKEVRFKKLVALGWGQTGYGLKSTPKLLKVSLKPITKTVCSKYFPTTRSLKEGLKAEHLCARDKKMDTCGGDSGGPLQVELMHDNRMTPFIVGITSFGIACGTSTPAVYTRVSTYYKWIINTMQKNGAVELNANYNEFFCASRFVRGREFVDYPLGIYKYYEPEQLALIGWNKTGPDCTGVIVDDDTVLTVADCTYFDGMSPNHIRYLNNKIEKIAHIVVHPNHTRGSAYNNIAVLKLENLLDVPENFMPSCVTETNNSLTNLIYGRPSIESRDTLVVKQTKTFNSSRCVVPKRFTPRLNHGLASEHLCLGQDNFLLPGTCEQITGSMIGYEDCDTYYTSALTLFSRDCGFGEHLISTRLESHFEWLGSVLLPNLKDSRVVYYVDKNLQTGDRCTLESGLKGKCLPTDRCSNQLKVAQKQVTFCSSKAVMCCSTHYAHSKSLIHPRILKCSKSTRKYSKKNENNGSLAEISWIDGNRTQIQCLGSIINRLFILSTASCLGKTTSYVVQLKDSKIVVDMKSILLHPEFDEIDRTNDIALIKLKNPLSWSSSVHPICLWTNQTETPMNLDINNITLNREEEEEPRAQLDTQFYFTPWKKIHPMYNSDCQKAHQHTIPDSQLCTRSPYRNAACVAPSDQLIWMDTKTEVKYLVGMSTNACGPYKWKYNVFTRISAFVKWISKHAFYNKR